MTRSIRFLLFTLALLSPATFALAEELPPGRLTNPGGLQRFQGAAYNSQDDEYLLIYQGDGIPRVRRLSVAGAFLAPRVQLESSALPDGVSNVGIVYNPTANEYLAIYRSDTTIYGRYLDNLGNPIGSRFVVGNGGAFGTADYSVTSDRYLVVWREGPKPITVRYALIDGDSSSADPVIERNSLAKGDNAHTAWGSQNDKFLVVYTRQAGTLREETFAKLVEGDGSDRSNEIAVMGGARAQTNPQVGYSSTHDVFLVSVEDWRKRACCRADVNGRLVDSDGNLVGSRFPIVNTGNGGWDVTGPIGFSAVTGQFVATSYIEPKGIAREISPADGSRQPSIELGNEVTVPIAIAIRSDPDDPQALILSRANLGGDGVHAHIVPLEIPPPTIAPTILPDGAVGTAYAQAIPVVGGTPPFTFEFVPGFGNVTPGLAGPNASTGAFTGMPTTAGVFGFRVRVIDDEGRIAEADLTHTVGLAAPSLQSPVDLATSNRMPTFDWDPVPGATSYELIVENWTKRRTLFKQKDLVDTEFTRGSKLPTAKEFRWRVKAMGGGLEGPYSKWAFFEIDTEAPPAIKLSGAVPDPSAPIIGIQAADASSQSGGKKKKENAVDGKIKTSWMSEGTVGQRQEFITLDLGAPFDVTQISLRSKRGPRFPADFDLQISNSPNSGFVTLASFSAFDAAGNTWYDFPVVSTTGRYVKVLVTKKGFHKGKFWAEISEINVFRPINTQGSIMFNFKSPIDKAGESNEPVASYDLRYMAGDAASFDWATATPFVGEPAPTAFGATEFILVQGLADGTTYSAAITSTDDAGNVSGVSNVVQVTTEPAP